MVRDIVVKLNATGGIGPDGEIDEAALEEVAGGVIVATTVIIGVGIGLAVAGLVASIGAFCAEVFC